MAGRNPPRPARAGRGVEDGATFEANAAKKALPISLQVGDGLLVLADDSGLEVDALGGAPGVYSARYAGEPKDDAKNNAKLLAALAGVPAEKRGAQFRCSLCLARDGAVVAVADEDRSLVRAREGDVPDGARHLYVDGELERDAVRLEDLGAAGRRPPLLGASDAFRSYASAPLKTHDGVSIGAVAAFGRDPRAFTEQELATLQDIADMAMHEIELRRAVRRHLMPRLTSRLPT